MIDEANTRKFQSKPSAFSLIKNFIMRTQPEDEEEEEEESFEDFGIQSLDEFFNDPGDDKSSFDIVEPKEVKDLES